VTRGRLLRAFEWVGSCLRGYKAPEHDFSKVRPPSDLLLDSMRDQVAAANERFNGLETKTGFLLTAQVFIIALTFAVADRNPLLTYARVVWIVPFVMTIFTFWPRPAYFPAPYNMTQLLRYQGEAKEQLANRLLVEWARCAFDLDALCDYKETRLKLSLLLVAGYVGLAWAGLVWAAL
jgi:hypothetical protein